MGNEREKNNIKKEKEGYNCSGTPPLAPQEGKSMSTTPTLNLGGPTVSPTKEHSGTAAVPMSGSRS